jgi:Rod binding domain-containing protein
MTIAINPVTHQSQNQLSDDRLMQAAQQLEASFLTEMLKSAGLGETSESFGGGIGESQFSSFLRQAQAEEMVQSGGIGLAQMIFDSLKESGE